MIRAKNFWSNYNIIYLTSVWPNFKSQILDIGSVYGQIKCINVKRGMLEFNQSESKKRDPIRARQCIEENIKLGNQHAFEFKILSMMQGIYSYEKDPNTIFLFLDDLATGGDRYALYL